MELQAGRAAEGEALLRQAIAQEPNSPHILNNLAGALEMQGRREESRALMIEIHELFPDYFFGRTNVAALAVQDGDLERARQLLAPALIQGRYHVSGFSALCRTQIALLVAEDQIEGASQ